MVLWLALNGGLLLLAYLLGTIPTGYLAGQILKGIDIRDYGSGSTGATNVLRTLGKGPAVLVLGVDVLKGILAIVLMRGIYGLTPIGSLAPESVQLVSWLPWMATLAGIVAILGHSKSIWLGFTGGKSAATGLGILLAMCWFVALGAAAVFGTALLLSRIVSLSSIAAAVAAAVLIAVANQPPAYQLFAIAAGVYIIWRHQTNIQRLLAGTEPRIGEKISQDAEDGVMDG